MASCNSVTVSSSYFLFALKNSLGGEIFVPKIPSYKITDLAKAICAKCSLEEIGVRQGEKIHEEMITTSDSFTTIDLGKYYVILPAENKKFLKFYSKKFKIKKVNNGFSYNSGNNKNFLKIEDLKKLIKININQIY